MTRHRRPAAVRHALGSDVRRRSGPPNRSLRHRHPHAPGRRRARAVRHGAPRGRQVHAWRHRDRGSLRRAADGGNPDPGALEAGPKSLRRRRRTRLRSDRRGARGGRRQPEGPHRNQGHSSASARPGPDRRVPVHPDAHGGGDPDAVHRHRDLRQPVHHHSTCPADRRRRNRRAVRRRPARRSRENAPRASDRHRAAARDAVGRPGGRRTAPRRDGAGPLRSTACLHPTAAAHGEGGRHRGAGDRRAGHDHPAVPPIPLRLGSCRIGAALGRRLAARTPDGQESRGPRSWRRHAAAVHRGRPVHRGHRAAAVPGFARHPGGGFPPLAAEPAPGPGALVPVAIGRGGAERQAAAGQPAVSRRARVRGR